MHICTRPLSRTKYFYRRKQGTETDRKLAKRGEGLGEGEGWEGETLEAKPENKNDKVHI